ncbi:MAG: hypothetical protein RL318_1296 [Fibrobacterota bacterium]|jgi:hypothetical protein
MRPCAGHIHTIRANSQERKRRCEDFLEIVLQAAKGFSAKDTARQGQDPAGPKSEMFPRMLLEGRISDPPVHIFTRVCWVEEAWQVAWPPISSGEAPHR